MTCFKLEITITGKGFKMANPSDSIKDAFITMDSMLQSNDLIGALEVVSRIVDSPVYNLIITELYKQQEWGVIELLQFIDSVRHLKEILQKEIKSAPSDPTVARLIVGSIGSMIVVE